MPDAPRPSILDFFAEVRRRMTVRKAFWVAVVILIPVWLRGFEALGRSVRDHWGDIVCWENDQTGQLGRTCALSKIAESKAYQGAEVTTITGIAEISENSKRVEFEYRLKPTAQNQQLLNGAVTFRKYDDGWRPSE